MTDFVDYRDGRIKDAGPYELAINLDSSSLSAYATAMLGPSWVVGRCSTSDGRRDIDQPKDGVDMLHHENWSMCDMEPYYPTVKSRYLGHIFCGIAHVPPPKVPPVVPSADPGIETPDILLGLGATRPAKLWPTEYWLHITEWIVENGFSVGILGADPQIQKDYYHSADTEAEIIQRYGVTDLRGALTLPQVVGALKKAKACVTIDNGIMHLSASQKTPTVAIFGGSAWNVWVADTDTVRIVLPTEACGECALNMYRNRECLIETHKCMLTCRPESVLKVLSDVMNAVT